METRVDEIAAGVYRLSTCQADAAPGGFTYNQFLLDADEPLLFHTGPRRLFEPVRAAVARVVPLDRLRWIAVGHYEADECGAMNELLAAAPNATVTASAMACTVSLDDQARRPPRPLEDGQVVDLGGKRVLALATPHVPHGWESMLLFEQETATLLAGDLFTQVGDPPAVTDDDLVGPALAAEDLYGHTAPTTTFGPTVRRLADLAPATLACMHGASFAGDGAALLRSLADAYERRFATPGSA